LSHLLVFIPSNSAAPGATNSEDIGDLGVLDRLAVTDGRTVQSFEVALAHDPDSH